MARINKKVKLFIVRLMAEFETPTDAARQVKDIFNVDVTPQQCEAYDPTKRTGQDLTQELRDLFFDYRRRANEELEAIPIANKRYRLQRLQNIIDHDQYKENPVLVPRLLEQAANEMKSNTMQLLDIELKKLEIQKLRDGEDGVGDDPTPVAVTINVVDASKKNAEHQSDTEHSTS